MARVINPASFVLGQNAALWVDKATSSQMKVMGLQGLGLGLGFTQTAQTITSMGVRISPKAYTGAEYDEMTANANFIPGDQSQDRLRQAALSGTILKNVRSYLKDGCNFSAPDQISAGGGIMSGTSGLNVGSWTDPQIGAPSDVWTNSVSFAPAGPMCLFVAHTVSGSGDEITAAQAGGAGTDMTLTTTGTEWATLGFDVDDTIIVDYGVDLTEPKYAKVKSIASDVMTLTASTGDIDDISLGTFNAMAQVHGATPMDVSGMDTTC